MSFDYISSILMPMLEGAQMTVLLFLIAIVVSIPMGFFINTGCRSNLKPLSWLAQGYIYVLRGTPLLLSSNYYLYASDCRCYL
ncbi:ABC transporter permease subunit [Bacillus cereus]|uniref:ABC transporter permease subunit n=1 Tax=Bacillus cereus TaxID=1396 RepID=UPI003BF6B891